MPDVLDPLWQTILHAPTHAHHAVADALELAFPEPGERARVLLAWRGHPGAGCPVCRMLVGPLVFSLPAPMALLEEALSGEPDPRVLDGACHFLSEHLRPRFARQADVERDAFDAMATAVREWPESLRDRLLTHWESKGLRREDLERAFR